ncbi:MAG TPA: type III pantothenate kinase, partial [Steroidobacteraceae bacterium]|nr:type III pantothenate kinase [Steroidobacteraceae bacterium]
MNALLLDAGNSRIKWALVREGRLGPLQAAEVGDADALGEWLERAPEIERVLASSVAGPEVERALGNALRRGGAPAAEFMQSSARAAGVSNGYRNPQQLGVDRWVGAVAAWNLAGCYRTVCAISIGTALTIDVVDHDGVHRGGLIAPSPTL